MQSIIRENLKLKCANATFLVQTLKTYIKATPSIFTERNDQCGNQHHSRELLMMGIVVPETC